MTIQPGTVVSTATLNYDHLIENYLDFLRGERAALAAYFQREWGKIKPALYADPDHAGLRDEQHFLLEDLEVELGRLAPDGCYFGALEGNTSEMGFWPIADDEDEPTDAGGPFDDLLDGRGEP